MKRVIFAAVAVLTSIGLVGHYSVPEVEAFTGVNELVSVDSSETQGNNHAGQWSSMSADGRYVVFDSLATNLVPSDTNGTRDIFVRDRVSGTTTRVNVSLSGVQANYGAEEARISESGRYVVFRSVASNLIDGTTVQTNGNDQIYMKDIVTGVVTHVSQSTTGSGANAGSSKPDVSTDGRFVTFSSRATNLVSGGAGGTYLAVYVRDTVLDTTTKVAEGNHDSLDARIDCSGRFIVFSSTASDLVSNDTNGYTDAFLADLMGGVSLANITMDGNGGSGGVSISCNGNYVALGSLATNLVAGDTNNEMDTFRYDRLSGDFILASVSTGGTQANDATTEADISGDGSYVIFHTAATSLVASDTNNQFDVFLRDMADGTTELVAGTSGGQQANNAVLYPAISADGQYVTYRSGATNLTTDTNGKQDIFISATGEDACTF